MSVLSGVSLRPSLAIGRHHLRVLRRDPMPVTILVGMPLAVMAFIQPALRFFVTAEGYPDATGAEQAVPGMAVLFAFFLPAFVGFGIFHEHGWGTWDRLRASPASSWQIIIGKVLVPAAAAVLQQAVLFGAGVVLFGLRIRGSVAALAVVIAALACCLVALGVVTASLCRTVQQVNAIGNLSAMVFGGVGGALVPVSLLPAWAQAVAPVTPTYWAMRGFRSVILDGAGVTGVLLPAAVLLAFAAALTLLALWRLRFDQVKLWA